MVNEILNFILVHTRSFFLLNLSKLFPPRVYLSRLFQLVHLENAINPASPRQQISMIPLLISGRRGDDSTYSLSLSFSRNFIRCKIIGISVSRRFYP